MEYEVDEFGDGTSKMTELYELRPESVINIRNVSSIITCNFFYIKFCVFYLCKVLQFEVATEDMSDVNNHAIEKAHYQ